MLLIRLSENGTQAHFKVTAQDLYDRGEDDAVNLTLLSVGSCGENFIKFLEDSGEDLGGLEKLVAAIFDAGLAMRNLGEVDVHQKVGEFYTHPAVKGLHPKRVQPLLTKVYDMGLEHGFAQRQAVH